MRAPADHDAVPLDGILLNLFKTADSMGEVLKAEFLYIGLGMVTLQILGSVMMRWMFKGEVKEPLGATLLRGLFAWILFGLVFAYYQTGISQIWFLIGEYGSMVSKWDALDPSSILISGVNVAIAVYSKSSILSSLGVSGLLKIIFCFAVLIAHGYMVYLVVGALIESAVLKVIGPAACYTGLSRYTWGLFEWYLQKSVELGFKFMLLHITLPLGSEAIIRAYAYTTRAGVFYGSFVGFTSIIIIFIFGLKAGSLPKEWAREMSSALFKYFKGPMEVHS